MLVTSIFSFSHNVFHTSKKHFQYLSHIKLSANAFKLDQSKILLFRKELSQYLTIIIKINLFLDSFVLKPANIDCEMKKTEKAEIWKKKKEEWEIENKKNNLQSYRSLSIKTSS